MVSAEMYARIDQFYALQMQALDDGDIAGWVATFTDDGVFASNGLADPVAGRDGLTALGNSSVARLDEQGAIRRFVNVYVGNDDVRFLEALDTATPEGAQVSVIPAVAGG